jgi:hypothetical protein
MKESNVKATLFFGSNEVLSQEFESVAAAIREGRNRMQFHAKTNPSWLIRWTEETEYCGMKRTTQRETVIR